MRTHCRMAIAAALSLLALAARATDVQQEDWSYEVVPYVWAAGLDGRVGIGDRARSIDARFQNLAGFLDVGATLRVSARRPPVVWFIEANYLGYEGDSTGTLRAAHVESTQTFGEAGLGYEFNPALALYVGVRAQQIDSAIDISSGHSEGAQAWLDGIAGVRWTPPISDRWMVWMRGDAGTGNSKWVWLAEAGGGYRWTERWAAYFAYRVLGTDYRRNGFVYDMRQSGLLFGFSAKF